MWEAKLRVGGRLGDDESCRYWKDWHDDAKADKRDLLIGRSAGKSRGLYRSVIAQWNLTNGVELHGDAEVGQRCSSRMYFESGVSCLWR